MYCTGVVHFPNRHACVTFWTHSCPATGNSKPDSPYQPACVRSVTSGLRSVRLCTASASWCWINGWNVRQKLNIYLLRRHDHTKVTWSPWLPFMISFFIWPWRRSRILKTSQAMGLLPDTENCGCACAGNAGNVFPATGDKRSRHASRHVRDARAVMHAGIAN